MKRVVEVFRYAVLTYLVPFAALAHGDEVDEHMDDVEHMTTDSTSLSSGEVLGILAVIAVVGFVVWKFVLKKPQSVQSAAKPNTEAGPDSPETPKE